MTTKKKTNPILTMKTETNNWYAMEIAKDSEGNATGSAEISIYDEIGGYGVTANDFIASLEALGEVSNIDLRISSPGGSIIEGNVIYNAIKRHPANVTVHIDGMAASMASVIAMAGDEIVMAENALLMIHNPWTVSIGDSEQLRKDADLMDKMKSSIINAYSRSGYDAEELTALMDATTWFTAEEALTADFIDRIDGKLAMAASVADMAAIAAKASVTLPVEKMIASATAKLDGEIEIINSELASANDQLAKNAENISALQTERDLLNARIEEMNTEHKAEIENAETATAQAVAAKAAELMALQTQEAIEEAAGDESVKQFANQSEYWKAYNDQHPSEKHAWHQANKHLLENL